MELSVAKPVALRCGVTLPNRLVKAAMAEQFAGKDHLPGSSQCLDAFRVWAQGGWGMVITGNVQVDPDHLGGAGDIAVLSGCLDPHQEKKQLTAWKAWAEAASENGTKAIVQLCHPGCQTPFSKGIAPSNIPLDFGSGVSAWLINSIVFHRPRQMTLEDIRDVVVKFADAARLAAEAGFAGVELHAAHGYLLTQFLSPTMNHRTDDYGGSARARAKIVVDIIQAIRAAVPSSFIIGIKLNSADHQGQGIEGDYAEQLQSITDAGVDFVEISGGTLVDPTFSIGPGSVTTKRSSSTSVAREAFFIEFAERVRSKFPHVTLMVTGGFRTRRIMEDAVRREICDLIGVARPAVLKPMLPRQLILNGNLDGEDAVIRTPEISPFWLAKLVPVKLVGIGAESIWYTKQIQKIRPLKGSILVTGSNGGLGSAIAARILSQPNLAEQYHGLYTVRSLRQASNISCILKTEALEAKHVHDLVPLDLASLASVRKVAEDINRHVSEGMIPPIRALILNAGYQEQKTQTFTADGFDMSFQANYLSHFLLTLLLLKSMDRREGRIVVLSSWMHNTSFANNWLQVYQMNPYQQGKYKTILNSTDEECIYDLAKGSWSSQKDHPGDGDAGLRRYGAAKLCAVMMFRELSKRLAKDPELSQMSVLAVDPAIMPSTLCRREEKWVPRVLIGQILLPILTAIAALIWPNGPFRTTRKSAADVLRAAFDIDFLGEKPNGTYLSGSRVSDVGSEARDELKMAQLWRDSIKLAQVQEGDTALNDWQ